MQVFVPQFEWDALASKESVSTATRTSLHVPSPTKDNVTFSKQSILGGHDAFMCSIVLTSESTFLLYQAPPVFRIKQPGRAGSFINLTCEMGVCHFHFTHSREVNQLFLFSFFQNLAFSEEINTAEQKRWGWGEKRVGEGKGEVRPVENRKAVITYPSRGQ